METVSEDNKVVLRPSKQYIAIGLPVAVIGGLFGAVFLTSMDEAVGKVAGGVGGAVFIAFGLALVFKAAVERITVDSSGITKNSAPSGKQSFRCGWADVTSYEALSEKSGGREGYMNVRSYVLNTKFGELRINAVESYFGALHSLILSRIPDAVRPKLPQTETPKGEPFEQVEEFKTSSAAANAASIVGLLLVVLVLLGLGFGIIFDWLGFEDMDMVKKLAGAAMCFLVAVIFGFVLSSRLGGLKVATYKVTSYGVQRRYGEKDPDSIPWKEMKSVEFLYEYYDRRTMQERREEIRVTPKHTYYYAIIGTEGEVFHFTSRMDDFGPFIASIVDHAPQRVAISLHTDSQSLRRL